MELLTTSNNPFNGLRNCLNLFSKQEPVTFVELEEAYKEVESDKEKLKMFYSLLFSIGDVTSRQHNIFKDKKVDSGGNANRESFEMIVQWMFAQHKQQFVKFLNAGLFNEFSTFDVLVKNRIKTNNGRIIEVFKAFQNPEYRTILVNYFEKVIKGNNTFNKMLIAKFLTLPRLSKRKGHEKMLSDTKEAMEYKATFLVELSKRMNWKYDIHDNYANFIGYREWRKIYNQELESVLFSTKKIFNLDQVEFVNWFDKLPAIARLRVINKISNDQEKYSNLFKWYQSWNSYKEQKQSEFRDLQERIRQNLATDDEKLQLKELEKEAKVNVGAINFKDLYNDISKGKVDKLKLETFINTKVNLPYNSLVIIDDSGSMHGEPFNIATFIASVCLYKNPDDDARNLLGFFNTESHWHTGITSKVSDKNSLIRNKIVKVNNEPLIDPKLSFYDNYERIDSFCHSVCQWGCTNISSIPEGLHEACQDDSTVLDYLKKYPVWTIISDGEFNNLNTPKKSMQDFMDKCEKYFGYKPFIVAIDINKNVSSSNNFVGVENMIYIPSNIGQIEQLLTNFKDSDCFDVFYPLLSVYRSNRYEIVRELVI